MDLQAITSLMLSSDYKDRMKAEYYHLQNRMENLEAVIKLWDTGERIVIQSHFPSPRCFSRR